MESIQAIKSYCDYLKTKANLSITVHFFHSDRQARAVLAPLPIPQVHFNPYCTYLKQACGLHAKCLKCQEKALKKCAEHGAFSGVCHAGIFEYVYPIKYNGKHVAILSVGEYRAINFDTYLKKICKENKLNTKELSEYSTTLKTEIPPKEEIDTLIIPLLSMIKLVTAVTTESIPAVKQNSFASVLSYCNRFYTKKITTEILSKKYFYSRSYIARTFKKETGMSLPEYINHLRIENAKQLLKSTKTDIAQIGASVGFYDPAYFTRCFTKVVGMTPKEWRKQNKSNSL